MDVLEFLKNIRGEKLEIQRLTERKHELELSLLPSAITYDGDRVQTSPSDHMLIVAAELDDLERLTNKKITQLSRHVVSAYKIIDQVPTPECRDLLWLRYIESGPRPRIPLSWMEIADRMGYSEAHVKGKLHGRAIAEARTTKEAEKLSRSS